MPGLNSEHPVEFFRILRLAYTKLKSDMRNGSRKSGLERKRERGERE
jgi:hypothetical protein